VDRLPAETVMSNGFYLYGLSTCIYLPKFNTMNTVHLFKNNKS